MEETLWKKKISALTGGGHPENRLQQARIRSGVTLEQIAEALSCDTRTIQRDEAGEISPTQRALSVMKRCYGCQYADLFPEETT